MLTLQMSGFVLQNSTIKHVSKQKSLVGFVKLTMQITLDRRHVLYSLVLVTVTVVVIGSATTCRSRRLPACGAAVVSASTCADVELCGRMCGLQSHPAVIR